MRAKIEEINKIKKDNRKKRKVLFVKIKNKKETRRKLKIIKNKHTEKSKMTIQGKKR